MPPPDLATDISWASSTQRRLATRELQPAAEVDSLWVSTTPVMFASPEFVRSARRVEQLSRLPPNWDSYGSARIAATAVEGALRVLKVADFDLLPIPHVAPVADGGLQLEWNGPEWSLEVEIRPTGAVEILVDLGKGDVVETSATHPEDVGAVLDVLLRR